MVIIDDRRLAIKFNSKYVARVYYDEPVSGGISTRRFFRLTIKKNFLRKSQKQSSFWVIESEVFAALYEIA